MEILNQRINVKAVKAYQTVEMEMTVSNATEEEITQVKAYLLNEAKIAVEDLARDIEGNSQLKQSTFKPQYQNRSKPIQNQGFNQYQANIRPASQKQLDYLRNAFNFIPQSQLTFDEANNLLMQFKSQSQR